MSKQENVQWKPAPIMHASTTRAGMKNWNARVSIAQMPRFPFEKEVCVPVKCMTIHRVNMQELCVLVEKAARVAEKNFVDARQLKTRQTIVDISSWQPSVIKQTIEIRRRQFPDRCFLTRQEQHQEDAWWNTSNFPLRQRQEQKDDDQLEFNWGYEDPIVRRELYKNLQNINSANEMKKLQWDQLDVRMYYFNIEMQNNQEWRELANGMWYVQD